MTQGGGGGDHQCGGDQTSLGGDRRNTVILSFVLLSRLYVVGYNIMEGVLGAHGRAAASYRQHRS